MARIDQLREQIEIERVKLNKALEKNSDLQASYEQSVLLDVLIEQYLEEAARCNG